MNALMLMPSGIHQTFNGERPWMPHQAKGTPLSVRIGCASRRRAQAVDPTVVDPLGRTGGRRDVVEPDHVAR